MTVQRSVKPGDIVRARPDGHVSLFVKPRGLIHETHELQKNELVLVAAVVAVTNVASRPLSDWYLVVNARGQFGWTCWGLVWNLVTT